MSGARTGRAEVPGTLVADYALTVPSEGVKPRELILVLHGHSLSGKIVHDKFAPLCPPDAVVLSPNAPYPLPERKPDGSYRVGFTWYFYNAPMDAYYIDMRVSLGFLDGLVRQLGYAELPKRIIGFSQGGYLAPFAALRLTQVRQVIGVAAEYLPDEIGEELTAQGRDWPLPFRADAVHGGQDDVVPAADGRLGHQKLLERGAKGGLVVLESEGHRLSAPILEAVRDQLSSFSAAGQ